jgi:putative FmdB family regulatory protein
VPLCEYKCRRCGERIERIEKVSGPHLKKCPKCGGGVERLVALPAIQFKGSGWYATDYARKGAASEGSSSESPGGEKAGKESKEADASKEAKKVKKES